MAATKPRTLYDKLFEEHIAAEQENGAVLLYIGRSIRVNDENLKK